MQNANESLSPGCVIFSGQQSYTIQKVLGCGAFGITYLAKGTIKIGNVSFDVPFAIKEYFIHSCYRDTDGITMRFSPTSKDLVESSKKDFLTEAYRLKSICNQSKHIVKVNETFEANGTAYYVMEYLSGGTLAPTSKRQAVDYLSQLCEAVKVLHANKMLHLDIKPGNVILKEVDDASEKYPVLIDFGISKHFDPSGAPTSSPLSKGVSMGYAPIEQYGNIDTFAPTLDIYALGATLFYMLTNDNPPNASSLCYDNSELTESLKKAGADEFIPFILKAMAPNKINRFQDIDALVLALRSIQLNPDSTYRKITDRPINSGTTLPVTIKPDEIVITGPLKPIDRKWTPIKYENLPKEERTFRIIRQQSFPVNGKKLILETYEVPWIGCGVFGNGHPLAPAIFSEIEPFSPYCVLPAPGPYSSFRQCFLGAQYRLRDQIGFLKVTDTGEIIDCARYSQHEYDYLSMLT